MNGLSVAPGPSGLPPEKQNVCNICGHPIEGDYLVHISQYHGIKFDILEAEEETLSAQHGEQILPEEHKQKPSAPVPEEEKKGLLREDSKEWVNCGPCETCGAMVEFENYVRHMRTHQIESVTPGNTKEYPSSAAELPRILYTGKGVDKACQICLMEYERDQILTYLPCVHRFHDECITTWLQQQSLCPICKRDAFGQDNEAEDNHSTHRSSTSGGSLAVQILIALLVVLGEALLT